MKSLRRLIFGESRSEWIARMNKVFKREEDCMYEQLNKVLEEYINDRIRDNTQPFRP